jgi:hypothetical protein
MGPCRHFPATKKKSRDPGSEPYLYGCWRLYGTLNRITVATVSQSIAR